MTEEEKNTAIQGLIASGYVVKTVDEQAKFLNNFKESEVEREIGNRIGQVHQRYDDDLFELVGKKKDSGQKTYDFNKQIIKELKSQAEKSSEFEIKVKDLEKKIKDGAGDEQLKLKLKEAQDELNSVRDIYTKDKDSWASEKSEHENKLTKFQKETILNATISAIPLKDDALIPRAAKEALIREIKAQLLSMSELKDGKLIFKSEKGEILRNKENALEPMTAMELLSSKLNDIIEIKPGGNGTGGQGGIPDGKVKIQVPATIKTLVQLSEYLIGTAGLARGTKEYQDAFNQAGKELPLN